MYHTNYFKAGEDKEVMAFMRAHPFVIVCGIDALGIPVATHVPVLLEERDGKIFLLGHFMRRQEHSTAFEQNPAALVIFSGSRGYVSASWYADQQKAGTWNYQAVHAGGNIKFLGDQGLYDLLVKLTRHFEGREDSPALVNKMPEEYLRQNMKAIIGFEIEVTRLEHVFKLSQNRQQHDYEQVVQHLKLGDPDSQELAAVMDARKGKVFRRD